MKKFRTIKKICVIISLFMFAIMFMSTISACTKGNGKQHLVTFDFNYDGAPAAKVVTVEDNTFVEEPETPERTNYRFLGWYSDKSCTAEADLERTITSDKTFYAGWELANITIEFNLNYEGGGVYATQTIAVGGTPERPDSPSRENYLFRDWYLSATEQTEANRYSFTALSTDTVIYAAWDEKTSDTAVVTYMWGYDGAPNEGVYETKEVNKGSKAISPVPERTAGDYCTYVLTGWKDADGETYATDYEFTVESDFTLYAMWHVVNTFEAEFTDMSNFSGLGWSWTRNGTTAIMYDKTKNHEYKAGTDAFVGNMCMKGSFIYFEIRSDRDATVELKLRLSVEAYFTSGIDFTPEILSVSTATNTQGPYTEIKYTPFHIDPVSGMDVAPFQNYTITTDLQLAEGTNYIVVQVTANFAEAGHPELAGQMGSMAAFAPVIDAMVLEHEEGETNLTWTPLVHNLWNYGYASDEYPCPCPEHGGKAE